MDTAAQTDHDILITLVETVKQQHVATMSKIEGVKQDVKDIKDGTAEKITDHERRIKALEDDSLSIGGVKEAWGRFLKVEKIVNDTGVKANAYRVVAGFAGGLIVFIFTQLPSTINSIIHLFASNK